MAPITFFTLRQAFEYKKTCPLCHGTLISNNMSGADGLITDEDPIILIQHNDLKIHANMDTSSICVEYNDFSETEFGVLKFKKSISNYNPGRLIIGVDFECFDCHQYYYNVAVHIDTCNKIFSLATLNSEWLEIENGPDVFTIRNIYATGITVYEHHLSNGDAKKCEIPIVPLNLNNPQETLERLKKLIIFT